MKSRHRRAFKWFLAFSFVAALGLTYVQIGLFPGQLREKAILELKRITHQDIHFDKAVYLPFSGLNLQGVRWYKEDGSLLFSAKRVAVNVKLIPFFQQKKIIIDHFVLDTPVYDLVIAQPKKAEPEAPKTAISGQISVPIISNQPNYKLEDIATGPDTFLPENVYLEQIEIINGVVRISPTKTSPVAETLRSINIRMGFHKPPVIRFDGNVSLGQDSYANVSLTGNWDLKKGNYTFNLKTHSKKVPEWLRAYQKNNFIQLQKGRLYLETQVWSGQHSLLLFHTHADLKEAEISTSPSFYQGHMKLEAEGVFDPILRKFEQYKGSLSMARVNAFKLSQQIDKIEDLNGEIRFEKDLLTVRSLRGEYKNIAFEAVGHVRSFKELLVNGEIRSALTMDQVRALIPKDTLDKIKDLKIEGQCQTLTQLTGSLKKGARVETQHKIRLSEGAVTSEPKNIRLKQVSGDFFMDPSGLRIQDLNFMLGAEAVQINGSIPKNTPPSGTIKARSQRLRFFSDFKVLGSDIHLSNATLRMAGASLAFRGQVIDWQKPHLNLQGQALIDLRRSLAWAAQTYPDLKRTAVDGTLEGAFTFNGSVDNWLAANIQMDASSKSVVFNQKFKLRSVQLQLRMAQKILNIPYFHADFYGGPMGSSWAFDLSKSPTPFVAKLFVNQVNLKELAKDLPGSQSKLSGTLLLNTEVSGILQNRPSWRGRGTLSITNGFIFQTDKFKAMGKLPLVRVEGLDWVTFHELTSEFTLENEKIHAPRLSLLGDSVNLSLEGDIHLNGDLDMLMDINYSEDVFRGAQATGGLANFMVNEAGRFISQHRVRGNLKAPVFEKNILPSGRAVGKTLGGIVQKIVS